MSDTVFDDTPTVSVWELHCERKVRTVRQKNRVTVLVVATTLSEAMEKGRAFYGDTWTVWNASHAGHRVILL